MRYSLEWLKEFVSIRPPLEKWIDRLTLGGLEVVSTEKVEGDLILEIEVTPNRPDLLSHLGLAREIAALTNVRLKQPRVAAISSAGGKEVPDITVLDKKGSPRYTGRLLKSVRVGPSPGWLKVRLERLGLRCVNNIVDITNFVLLEWGQPLHAFDYDRIAGGRLLIRSARAGERLVTIDGENRQLREGQLVIADAEKPVAIAGVIGGKGSEISEKTQRVLLESAFFDPVRIRQGSRALGLVTESSYRFERGVSWDGVLQASNRAAALLGDVAGAIPAGPLLDIGKRGPRPTAIPLHVASLAESLGNPITATEASSFLKALGCKTSRRGNILRSAPPSFRRDLKEEVDLIEEIARLFGYDRIRLSLPSVARASVQESVPSEGLSRRLMAQVRSLLIAQGLFEVMTYSLLSRTLQAHFSGKSAIAIQNPLSLDQELMRSSLLPRLAEVAAYNLRHKAEGVSIFELGPVYEVEANGTYRERQSLGILFAGKTPSDWKTKSRLYDYFDLKGKCDLLCETLGLERVVHQETSFPFLSKEGATALTLAGGEALGYYGEFSLSIREALDMTLPVYAAELDMTALLQAARPAKRYAPIPKHPSVARDIALVIQQGISSQEIQETIRRAGGEFLRNVFLFDEYLDPGHRVVPKGSRGLAYRMEFLHPQRTLTQQEVDQTIHSIAQALIALGAQIRV